MRPMPGPNSTRHAPFSIRFTPGERARLYREAGKTPLGTYIKTRLFGDRPAPDQMAAVLAKLGKSEIASSLREMARLARLGALPITPETEAELHRASADIAEIKSLLMKALRIKEH